MEWINILKCPITGKDLRALEPSEIEVLNKKAAGNKLWQADGKPMTEKIEKGLVTTDGSYIYPIIKEIVLLLKDLAVVDAPGKIITDIISDDKKLVKNFYDQKGWFTDEQGNYEDAVIFEDLRPFAQDYIKKCHDRVSRFLNPAGTYMIDAASGALQYTDYLQYSANYTYRVCVDFSFQALSECKRKLGDKGLCILADMTNMPFKDGVADGFVSLNTIYHIPKDEQTTAIKELYRLLKPGTKGVVVYEWFKHSPWMNFWMLPFRGFVYIKNRVMDGVAKLAGKKDAGRRLYYYAHSPAYFQKNLPPFSLKVWRSLSVHFMRYYLHSGLFGKKILDWVYKKEEKDPAACGLKGEYPMLVFEKP
ncbi:MAG: class I SAM-dependent methyltransferase [Bacteroidota bacterium]